MPRLASLTLVALLAASPVIAKDGVKDPAVQARMAAMDRIAAATKALGQMAGGERAFDAAAAAEAAAVVAAEGATVTDLFAGKESDPVSEALPAIWENWGDFSAKADALANAALALDTSSQAALAEGMPMLAGACKSCHSRYRQ